MDIDKFEQIMNFIYPEDTIKCKCSLDKSNNVHDYICPLATKCNECGERTDIEFREFGKEDEDPHKYGCSQGEKQPTLNKVEQEIMDKFAHTRSALWKQIDKLKLKLDALEKEFKQISTKLMSIGDVVDFDTYEKQKPRLLEMGKERCVINGKIAAIYKSLACLCAKQCKSEYYAEMSVDEIFIREFT